MKKLIALIAKGFAFIIYHLPKSIQLFFGDLFAHLWWDILRVRRDIVFKNLDIAFPEWSEKKKKQVAWDSMKNIGRSFIEYFKYPFLNKQNIDKWVNLEGAEHLQAALDEGKGVCVLSMHTGSGDMALAGLVLNGFPIQLISKEFKLKWLNEMWFKMRGRLGTKFIPPRNSSFQVLRGLKKKDAVIFVLDQYTGPPIGCKTQFFGKETGTALGLAVMVRKTKAPVIPVYDLRVNGDEHRVIIDKPIAFEDLGDKDETLKHMTQKYTNYIEEVVRKHPEQWMWVHRRWKKFS